MNRCLFLDDWHIARAEGLELQAHLGVRHPGNPLMAKKYPWEAARLQLYGQSIVFNPEKKLYQTDPVAAGDRAVLFTVNVPPLEMSPPAPLFWPFWTVTPEMVAVIPEFTAKTPTAWFPLTARLEAPGPLIVMLVPIVSVLLSVMVPVTLKLIVSPEEALAIAARNESGPLSFVFLTVIVAPTTGKALNSPRIRKLDRTEEKIEAGFLSIIG